ncbi:MAG: GAF domain-containing protein [Proteobacteria bacterium]|nr:GAF domain-containing protein [Pseudomonadota bacterium]MBU1717202.1 GAF domain-containing protein [Pseudomonadota bacterium]
MSDNKLYYKLNIIFILLLLFPCAGFLYFGYKYDLLHDNYTKIFIVIGLVYIFVGFTLLRRLFDRIINISQIIKEKISKEISADAVPEDQNELQQIVQSFNAIELQFRKSSELLAQKASEVSILKELSDLCYVTLDPWEILHVTLERALLLASADVGSIMILDKSEPRQFIVKASIGLGDHIQMDSKIDFETSIAKYAVINKTPLVIEDIEKERRFGRTNRIHYGTKSFVIMPIKTIKDVIGVLTISRKDESRIFSELDVEALSPLLSNAAFTFENIRLMRETELENKQMAAFKKIFTALNSSLLGSELLHTVLNEVQNVLPFEFALVMTRENEKNEHLSVIDIISNRTSDISIGDRFKIKGGMIEKSINQGSCRIIDAIDPTAPGMDKKLFVNHGLKSCLIVPLTMRGDVNGGIIFYAKDSKSFHECQDLSESIAKIVSFTIDKGRLATSVVKRNQELVAIKQIGSALASSTFDINNVLKYTMDMIRTLMNVEAGSLSLVKDDQLEFAVAFEIDVSQLKKFRMKMGQGISGAVAALGEPIIENDAPKSSYFHPEIDISTGFTTRSVLCVPMISQGKVMGVIEVLNKLDGDFTEGDKGLLQSIATSVSIAMENARLYKETVLMAEQERGIRGIFQKFVPKEVIEKIIHGSANNRKIVDEFKTITLLNLDIRNFSKLTRKIGPIKSVAMLNQFFSIMGGIVFKHHGIVDKYLGDGFLALFGAPVSTAMDAENAVSAALEMQFAIESLNEDYLKAILDDPVYIGVSIFTGEVVVGNIGFDMKMDYTVIGDSVNNVFRLQDLTKTIPNGILVSESTVRAVQSPLETREIEKTIAEMKVYELLGR